jgi:cell division protein FtsA
MDTRIGYPSEHLASNATEEVKSPLYATGVGLVIKGLERIDKQRNKTKNVKTHSKRTKGNFFDKIFMKSKQFFEDDEVN